MMSNQPFPALNLRMKRPISVPTRRDLDMLTDQLSVMAQQEMDAYHCGDYLLLGSQNTSSTTGISPLEDQELDALARKKMIDWMFRVVDHYYIDRETVAVATSILDRFLYQCKCDRMTFKLSAMTSLYMAVKIQDPSLLAVEKLAELSRGEFSVHDIVNMESIILDQLSWKVNPVTVHSFIHAFINFIPVSNQILMKAIYDRAIFFAEICLFDYSYVTKSRSTIAAAALLNALEGVDGCLPTAECERELLRRIQANADLRNISRKALEEMREDLWFIYSMSAQYHEEDLQMMPVESATKIVKEAATGSMDDFVHIARSPVSIVSR